MCGAFLQVAGQVDDGDGLEGTLLDADAAADTEALGDGGELVGGRHLDTQLPHAHHRAGLFALLPAPKERVFFKATLKIFFFTETFLKA